MTHDTLSFRNISEHNWPLWASMALARKFSPVSRRSQLLCPVYKLMHRMQARIFRWCSSCDLIARWRQGTSPKAKKVEIRWDMMRWWDECPQLREVHWVTITTKRQWQSRATQRSQRWMMQCLCGLGFFKCTIAKLHCNNVIFVNVWSCSSSLP